MIFSSKLSIRHKLGALAAAMTLTLAACGGGSGGADQQPENSNPSGSAATPTPMPKPKDKVIGTAELQPATFVVEENRKLSIGKSGTSISGKTYKINDVLIIDNPRQRGIFKVTAITKSKGKPVYKLENAKLSDAFQKLDVDFKRTLTPDDIGKTIETGDPELKVSWVPKPVQWAGGSYRNQFSAGPVMAGGGSDPYLEVKLANGNKLSTSGLGVTIDGKTTFKLNPDIAFDFDLGKASYNLTAKIQPAMNSNYTIKSHYGGGQIKRDFEKKFPKKPGIAWRGWVMAGFIPVPIWVTWQGKLGASLAGKTSGKMNMNANYKVSGTLGVQADNAQGVRPLAGSSASGNVGMNDVEAELKASAYVPKVGIEFMLYGLAGPSFDTGLTGEAKGVFKVKNGPPKEEGIQANANLNYVANVTAKLDLGALIPDATLNKKFELYRATLPLFDKFFPFTGEGAIVVNDNGSVKDDIFRVAVDDVVLGVTSKGGSGQFRVKSMAPGNHKLTITTIEDDAPPGTWEITLNDGLTFSDGATYDKGTLRLNQSKSFGIIVPKKQK